MPKRSLTSDEIEQIAILYADHKKKQAEIAPLFSVSPATINRIVKELRAENVLIEDVRLNRNMHPRNADAARSHLGDESLLAALKRIGSHRYRATLAELYVVPVDQAVHSERLESFARPIARVLARNILESRVRVLGVSWGIALLALAKALTHEFRASAPERIDCVPISGSPPDVERFVSTSSPHIANQFSQALNGEAAESPSFFVGSWISREFKDAEVKTIRRFAMTSRTYRDAFMPKGLIARMDCAITSIGPIGDFAGPWLEAAAAAAGCSTDDLSAATVGNVSGQFLPRPDASRHARDLITKVNARWLGATLDHLRNCSERAAASRKPGVVLLAMGEHKADVVLEAIRHGVVRTLFIDNHLKLRLERLTSVS